MKVSKVLFLSMTTLLHARDDRGVLSNIVEVVSQPPRSFLLRRPVSNPPSGN